MDKISLIQGDTLHVQDELMPLFNKVATQLRFHTISGKNEVLTVGDIVSVAQEFFTQSADQQFAKLKAELEAAHLKVALARVTIAEQQSSLKRKSRALRNVEAQRRSLRQTVKRRR